MKIIFLIKLFLQPTDHAKECTHFQGMGLTSEEKKRIVNLHNEFRTKVADGKEKRGNPGPQLPASEMPDLVNKLFFTKLLIKE